MNTSIEDIQIEVINISKTSEKVANISTLLSTLKECKNELQKCGIYLNENIETKQQEWNSYFGL